LQFFFIAQNAVNLRHGGEIFGIGLRRASGDNHRLPVAFGFARRLPCLPQSLLGYRAAINDGGFFKPGRFGQCRYAIAFQRV
jgi:hypothetical protein